ncbi:HlyD family efflux transporter periplasmic adaptor subunit [Haliea sp. AH-315-K21]|nr:HlyD family efflux transporter periplasmic adaptor subunit [Haliea sp. AH-315-K21]MBN4075222.1 HlyD family efflux transporter periplasmic adaptor subunit [Gammaproteobacteria bacterium AH-315-E17]
MSTQGVLVGSKQNEYQEERRVPMILVLAVLLGVFLIWAALFEFDTTIRAMGDVIPRARTQVIQAADGGVLSELLVREGSVVAEGELLSVMEKERASAGYQEERARVTALEVALLRARTEIYDDETLDFGAYQEEIPGVVRAQREYYDQRKRGLQEELGTLQTNLDMASVELQMNERLLETGDVSAIEVMRAERQVNDVRGQMLEIRNDYLEEAHQEITRTEAELESLRYKLNSASNILDHTEIVSPVAGVVKYLTVTTLGGVLRAGDELMQISPSEGGVVIEAKIMPADIGKLELGMLVFIKLDAFDFSIYGNLQGTLEYISSGTLTERDASGRDEEFYLAQIGIDEEHMARESNLSSVVLKPGMKATIDIRTGSKTVLNYLYSPIAKTFSGAVH